MVEAGVLQAGVLEAGPVREKLAREALAMLNGRSLVLVGMMGAGKTSVGKRLASRLDQKCRIKTRSVKSPASR